MSILTGRFERPVSVYSIRGCGITFLLRKRLTYFALALILRSDAQSCPRGGNKNGEPMTGLIYTTTQHFTAGRYA